MSDPAWVEDLVIVMQNSAGGVMLSCSKQKDIPLGTFCTEGNLTGYMWSSKPLKPSRFEFIQSRISFPSAQIEITYLTYTLRCDIHWYLRMALFVGMVFRRKLPYGRPRYDLSPVTAPTSLSFVIFSSIDQCPRHGCPSRNMSL